MVGARTYSNLSNASSPKALSFRGDPDSPASPARAYRFGPDGELSRDVSLNVSRSNSELPDFLPTMRERSNERRRGATRTITMPRPLPDGRLGLAVKDLKVVGVLDPAAAACGWTVGDRILSVNDVAVTDEFEFGNQVAAAVQSSRVFLKPLKFEVVRDGRNSLGCC